MYGQNSAHTGRSPYRSPQRPVTKWVFKSRFLVNTRIVSSPVVDRTGTIYFVASPEVMRGPDPQAVPGSRLFAVRPDGTKKWGFRRKLKPPAGPTTGVTPIRHQVG